MVSGEVNRVIVSICPSVWSPSSPSSSHTHVRRADRLAQVRFQIRLAQAGIAMRRQQALAGGEHRASAVDLDGSALHHDAWLVQGNVAEDARDVGRNLVVEIGRVLVAPAVELPVDQGDQVAARDKRRPAVAQPQVLVRDMVKPDRATGEAAPGILLRVLVGQQEIDGFAGRDGLDKRRELAAHRLEHADPLLVVMRPGHPRGGVRVPLGRHGEAALERRRGHAPGTSRWTATTAPIV